ncbi:VOC family protein [Kribbella sp. CA-293567]|uniref:VOC family protein n=1 Tax=Kribbella sp. CA-293567 TaxID=3002436 RepID=UPI0022DE0CEC|nr:VOC family protein [Kribbella sp. CA-293567]WBQ02697.1 VOC family protein [Kribbella sp. CA-293567]
MTVKAIPEGYTTVTPWLISPDTDALLDYLTRAFGAQELFRVADENGVIGHAEMQLGDAKLMMFDARPGWPSTPAFLRLYVEDAHATYRQAIEAGGTSVTEVTHVPWGDLIGRVRDPFGNLYWIMTRIEDLTEDELAARYADPEFVKALDYVQSADFFSAE